MAARDGGTWSPVHVLRHLVWCDVDEWIPRARLILQHQDRVAFTPFDPEVGDANYAAWTAVGPWREFMRILKAEG